MRLSQQHSDDSGGPDFRPAAAASAGPVDRLLLDSLAATPGRVAVVDDPEGALTLGAAERGASDVRTHQDLRSAERRLLDLDPAAELGGLDGALLHDADTVLLRLPASLDALEEIAEAVAMHAPPSVTVLAGGRVKHMTHAMNDVLARWFGDVHATLGRQKSRVLVATGVSNRPPAPSFPRRAFDDRLGLWVCAHGGVFAGTRVDAGSRLLLDVLPRMAPDAALAVDLGCGTGVLAAALTTARPRLQVVAVDDSAAAVASATATAAANGVADRVRVVHDDATDPAPDLLPDQTADLVVCNPPFHRGAAVDDRLAPGLFRTAARLLRPGGQLWTVANGHLDYQPTLERLVGRTDVVGRNPRYRVTLSRRR